ncbi:jg18069 [Pararge aegeria aegeria]|uniref:Jg18069 protein n=1 Tax=Pararge aegeria aegeria TaxID=348720 RepID=A0A8S4QN03_9NEOP|nr:jg18069 [Pararge aegeria aegeria]
MMRQSGQGHASKVVFKLLEERLDSGHHVYMDNYYNSYGLAVKLLDRQTYCTGTLRKNRRDNPVEIGTIPLKKGENKSLFLNGVHIGKLRIYIFPQNMVTRCWKLLPKGDL